LNTTRNIALLEASFAVIVWGGSFVATKIALTYVSPVTVVWLRFAMGVTILGIFVLARRQFAIPSRKDAAYFALLGFIGITFHQWLQSTGLTTAQATTTAWIVATTPVFIALLGWLLLKEVLDSIKWAGIFLAALGVLLIVTKGNLATLSTGQIGTAGDLLILISAPNWAIFTVLSRRGLETHPAALMMLYVMGFGWLFTSLLFFGGPGVSEIGQLPWQGWLSLAFLGIACSGLAYVFWYDALQAIPASQVGVFLYLEPLVTTLLAAALLSETLLWSSILGGAIILLGVWMVNRRLPKARPS
jgi:drug/metabolite transporter (DMT)-like permease